jgi:hypothetical protein
MSEVNMPELGGELAFAIDIEVAAPILVGQDERAGRRQLIPITAGRVYGPMLQGEVLPGGVDSQAIRPDGLCELSARYALRLVDGTGIYIENNGIRSVPAEYVDAVKRGEFIDPALYYFRTTPKFEVYDEANRWLTQSHFCCIAKRTPETVQLGFYRIL